VPQGKKSRPDEAAARFRAEHFFAAGRFAGRASLAIFIRAFGLSMYNERMARGWESKAVDDQIQDANETRKNGNPRNLSPAQIDAVRQRKVLELSRVRVTSDLENNQDPRYRSLLLRALEDLDAQIARLKAAG